MLLIPDPGFLVNPDSDPGPGFLRPKTESNTARCLPFNTPERTISSSKQGISFKKILFLGTILPSIDSKHGGKAGGGGGGGRVPVEVKTRGQRL